jgi:CTD kinase subunit alpha
MSRWMSSAALDLAEQLLTYDPSQRVTAVQAMEAPYFTQEAPSPEPPVGFVKDYSSLFVFADIF